MTGSGLFLPQTAVFDCDGVLFDSWEATMHLYNRLMSELGLDPLTREDESFVFASTVEEGLQRLCPPELLDQARRLARDFDVSLLADRITLQPGAAEFVDFLRRRGSARFVLTNGGEENREILRRTGLFDRFDGVVAADDLARPKPDPEGLLRIMARSRAATARTVFIGDSETDRAAAEGAGVRFWAYQAPQLAADYHFDDFRELMSVLDRPDPQPD